MTKRYARIARAQVRQVVNGLDSVLGTPGNPERSILLSASDSTVVWAMLGTRFAVLPVRWLTFRQAPSAARSLLDGSLTLESLESTPGSPRFHVGGEHHRAQWRRCQINLA